MLLLNGYPSQIITGDKIRKRIKSNQLGWLLMDVSLSLYAKVGGIPWLVDTEKNRDELIIGISRARDKSKKYVVGFVVLFTHDGDYLFLESQSPVVEWEKYTEGLKQTIINAYNEYISQKGTPEVLILQFHKNPGKRELSAIEKALRELNIDIPFAMVHINEFSNFRVFDTSSHTFVPKSGLKVQLTKRTALLLVDGTLRGKRSRMGVPHVLSIKLDKRSTIDASEFSYLVKQIYRFAYVNWRGFNARYSPVTINYSKLISRLILDIGPENWVNFITSGRLKDKAWFL